MLSFLGKTFLKNTKKYDKKPTKILTFDKYDAVQRIERLEK